MSSPYFSPYEIEVVEWLADAVCGGRFGGEVQLVVRPHPQNVQGYMADPTWLPRLNALIGARVAVAYPSLGRDGLAWNMDEEDLPRLTNLLAGCSICLNSGSTLTIDAIVQDKPVILTMFDAARQLPWWQSTVRLVSYPHIEKMLAFGGVRVASSFDAMAEAIFAYLDDPQLDAAGRAAIRRSECGPCDGQASHRIAAALARAVAAEKRQPMRVVSSHAGQGRGV
jgi:hypothetical protein